MPPGGQDKLWRYATLTRLWSWSLLGSAIGLLALSILLQGSAPEGLTARWFATAIGMTGVSGAIFYPLLRMWMRKSALPSLRLDRAQPLKGRLLEAGRADWRRWSTLTAAILFVGSAMMLSFLVGVLERGGTAEGVVIGTLFAWGVVTLEDARRIDQAEEAAVRCYWAACARPVAIADRLVWTPGHAGAAAPAEPVGAATDPPI